jgi:hypothetical protein
VHGPAAAFDVYKSRAHPAARPSSLFNLFPTLPHSGFLPHHAPSTPLTKTHSGPPSVGLAAAENPASSQVGSQSSRSTTLPSILVSVCDDDYFSKPRPIGGVTSMDWLMHHLLVAPQLLQHTFSVIATTETAIRPGQLKECLITTWMASAWLCRGITYRGKDLGELPCVTETMICTVYLDLG